MREIRPLVPGNQPEWERFCRGYTDFCTVKASADKLAALFDWLLEPAHPCNGLVAVAKDGGLAGFAYYRAMPSPLRGAEVGFLDERFADPYRRGDGAGKALLRRVDEITETRGWGVVPLITRENNYRTHSLYYRLSNRFDWINYEMTLATTGLKFKR